MGIFTSCLICTPQEKEKKKEEVENEKRDKTRQLLPKRFYTFLSLLEYHINKILHTIVRAI